MKQIELTLTPSPGAKPEFLATVEPLVHEHERELEPTLDSSFQSSKSSSTSTSLHQWNQQLPSKINLEGYTRDAWAWKPSRGNDRHDWTELKCVSVDGRHKLPGFIKYLKDRQKSAYGRFSPTGVWVVSYIQKETKSDNEMSIRLCFDISKLEACPLNKSLNNKHISISTSSSASAPSLLVHKAQPPKPEQGVTKPAMTGSVSSSSSSTSRTKSGLLGNLLGATKRTNQHMEHSAKIKPPPTVLNASASSSNTSSSIPNAESRTAQQVLNEFRLKMEQEMLDFDSCNGEVVLRVPIVLQDMQRGLVTDADKARITMETMKYIVIEAAEECNEDWIAHREPSEFVDECVICVYKDGHAPEDVMEEVNRVELTEDMRGEQYAIQETMKRRQAAEEAKKDEEVFKKAIREQEEEEIAVLNTNKRDRRTIEEIQLGVGQSEKKRKQ